MDLKDKVAVVTGAGSGIGRATAIRLAREGVKVLIADCAEDGSMATVSAINAAGGEARFVPTDVSSEDDVRRMIDMAESVYGGLDILHNNAGVLGGPRFPDSPPKYWSRAIDINLRGVLYGIHYGVPALKRRGGGVIVNTTSTAGLTPMLLDPVYAATKAAIVNLTRSLTFLQEEAGVRVNCVCPGPVDTALERNTSARFDAQDAENFRQRRAGSGQYLRMEPDEVAKAVLRLIQDDALNGISCRVVSGAPWELLPSPLPPKFSGR